LSDLATAAELGRDKNSNRVSPGRIRIADLSARPDEIGRLSSALRGMVAALYERIETNEQFAADVAHEIKNPLSSLRSATETFSRAKTAAQKKQLLNVILQDVQRLDRLITDISQASRVDTEIIGQDRDPVDLASLIDNFIQMRSQTHSQYQLRYEHPPLPVMVRMNESRMVQVIDNVLSNAISFSPKGGMVQFILTADATRKNAVLEILDDGPGIPDAKLETVFDRFYTERPSDEGFGEHSGLGLSIARQIVDAHNGQLTAKNRPEGGACFRLVLPLES